MPNDAIDYQAIQAIAQAIQIGNQAIANKQQLDLEKKKFEQHTKDQAANIQLREQRLELETERIQLQRTLGEAKLKISEFEAETKRSRAQSSADVNLQKYQLLAQRNQIAQARLNLDTATAEQKKAKFDEENFISREIKTSDVKASLQAIPLKDLQQDYIRLYSIAKGKQFDMSQEAYQSLWSDIADIQHAIEFRTSAQQKFRAGLPQESQKVYDSLFTPQDVPDNTVPAVPSPELVGSPPTANVPAAQPHAPGQTTPQAWRANPAQTQQTILAAVDTPQDQTKLAQDVLDILTDTSTSKAQRDSLRAELKKKSPAFNDSLNRLFRERKAAVPQSK
jgi:hypothetical protein